MMKGGILNWIFVCALILHGQTAAQPVPTVPTNWWQYPPPFDVLNLFRSQLRLQRSNLVDSYPEDAPYTVQGCLDPQIGKLKPIQCPKESLQFRLENGQCNDIDNPGVGSVYYRFGRNVFLNATVPDECNLLNPNPRDISRELLARKEFIPAPSINILVAGWIQFMIHDWYDSGPNDRSRNIFVPVRKDDPNFHYNINIPSTRRDSCANIPWIVKVICKCPHPTSNMWKFCKNVKSHDTFQSTVTHWWDASQLYGSDVKTNKRIRTGVDGKLVLTQNGRLPLDIHTGIPIAGNTNNWWVGLELFHILWTKEHNYICDQLKARHPTWSDHKLFNTARLIVAAVIAKIHTLEWTTAILQNDIVKIGLKSNWYGVTLTELSQGNRYLAATLLQQMAQLINGIPGAAGRPTNMRGVPFSITQDFIAVYRLHPLVPDKFEIRDHRNGHRAYSRSYDMSDAVFQKADEIFRRNSVENLLTSFGQDYAGAMTLNNYPNFLRHLNLPLSSIHGEGYIDLATIDILRDRERGVPRYNEFRRQLHLTPISRFEDLTPNKDHVNALRRMYNNNVELIDLLVGSLAESPRPEGFGFSDTFFRIFVLMARRRIETDRFFTENYTEEFYTSWGLDYIDRTYMKEVMLRHYPSLNCRNALHFNVTNVFIPWQSQTTFDVNFPYPIYNEPV